MPSGRRSLARSLRSLKTQRRKERREHGYQGRRPLARSLRSLKTQRAQRTRLLRDEIPIRRALSPNSYEFGLVYYPNSIPFRRLAQFFGRFLRLASAGGSSPLLPSPPFASLRLCERIFSFLPLPSSIFNLQLTRLRHYLSL